MRNGQNKRMRGRNNRKGQNPLTRIYESNGPDVKIRGTANHVADKYVQLARDAQSSGDPVAAENYFQHAEHYFRLIAAAQEQFRQANPYYRPENESRDDARDDGSDEGDEGMQQPFGGPAQPNFQQPYQQPHHQPREQPYPPREQPYVPREQPQPNRAQPSRTGGRRRTAAVLHHRRRATCTAGSERLRRKSGRRRRSFPAASPAPAPSRTARRHAGARRGR